MAPSVNVTGEMTDATPVKTAPTRSWPGRSTASASPSARGDRPAGSRCDAAAPVKGIDFGSAIRQQLLHHQSGRDPVRPCVARISAPSEVTDQFAAIEGQSLMVIITDSE